MIGSLCMLLYSVLLIGLIRGNLNLLKGGSKQVYGNIPFVSIVVPFRDEKNNLKTLIEALESQNYPREKYEVLLIDDHSEDGSVDLAKELITSSGKLLSFHQLDTHHGKKEAIKKGVSVAKGDFILTTDADCKMGANWLEKMIESYCSNGADFIIGPVSIDGARLSFQSVEFATIISVTSGTAGLGKPIICNGANLGFRKDIFERLTPYERHQKELSGDDVFFLHELKNTLDSAKINFVASAEALVKTNAISGASNFLNQRTRWARKTRLYQDRDSLLTGAIISLMNGVILFHLIMGDWFILITLFIIKFSLDTSLLMSARKWIGIQSITLNAFLLSLLYPFYFLIFALLSLLYKPKWKGRKT